MSKLRVSRTFKIIYSCILWLLFLSFAHPAFGAWDTLSAEVTFTAQTGIWIPQPTPSPTAVSIEEPPVPEVEQEVPLTVEPQSAPNASAPTPETPTEPTIPPTPAPETPPTTELSPQ